MAQAFGGPAHQSLVPSLVDKEHLPNAIALNSIQFNLARVIGPLIAGAALTAFGMAACFGLNGLSFLAVIVALLSLHIKHMPSDQPQPDARGAAQRIVVRETRARADRAHRARVRDDVPGDAAADIPAAVRPERVRRRRRSVHAADGLCRRRRRDRRARRRLARQVQGDGQDRAAPAVRAWHPRGALRGHPRSSGSTPCCSSPAASAW